MIINMASKILSRSYGHSNRGTEFLILTIPKQTLLLKREEQQSEEAPWLQAEGTSRKGEAMGLELIVTHARDKGANRTSQVNAVIRKCRRQWHVHERVEDRPAIAKDQAGHTSHRWHATKNMARRHKGQPKPKIAPSQGPPRKTDQASTGTKAQRPRQAEPRKLLWEPPVDSGHTEHT